jgi:hypothetical protein
MFKAGADGLMIKPTGKDDAQTRILTREYAPKLIEELARIIDSQIDNFTVKGSGFRAEMTEKEKAGEDLISSWKEFRNK